MHVERLLNKIKAKSIATSFELLKRLLFLSIEKIIWILRISKQTSIGCTLSEKHCNRTANTR